MILSTDTTGDLVFEGGQFQLVDDAEAIRQMVTTALRMLRFDSFLIGDFGWDMELVSSGIPLEAIEGMARDTIASVPGVVGVTDTDPVLEVDATRNVAIDCTIQYSLPLLAGTVRIADTLSLTMPGSIEV